ncbi:hypothetical protein GKC29_14915 [Micromonospora sp. WMMC415]|uniref:DUF6119 family protein n=1 Tax=Micromonospora sp. WMMC415 TaxID=2675222 RepID=UPI0012B4DA45|nr:DUF6119 family protein [Micromonospora sp. WMMC415]QGN48008.1 hypothetical protein GKC29_14915 [Micromonospora sp. WMMC415]
MTTEAVPADLPPKLRFNCYLLRPDLETPEHALRAPYRPKGRTPMNAVAPSSAAPDGTIGYFSEPKQKVPPWAKALAPLFPDLKRVQNLSNRFVIILPVAGRHFAVCFGYGSSTLEWSAVEANFGLRFAARRMSPKTLREFRSRRVGASNRTQAIQIPMGGDIKDLDVTLEGEFVRRLAGTLEEGDGAQFDDVDAVAATDAISFRARTDLSKVQETLAAMLAEVEQKTAAEGLKFVDSLEPLRAKSERTAELDRRLAESLFASLRGYAAGDDVLSDLQEHLLEFSYPDALTTDEIDKIFVYRGERSVELPATTVEGVRQAISELKGRLTARSLDGIKLMAFDADGEPRSPYLPLRHWLIYEAGDADKRYILTLGRWFSLLESYTRKLDEDLRRIEDLTGSLKPPSWIASQGEGDYNGLLSTSTPGRSVVLDTVDIRSEDGDEIEACDVFHESGYLLHVKRFERSQTLSHLFSQGLVSALSLRRDDKYREQFLREVENRDPSLKAAAEAAPQVVVYGIGVRKNKAVPLELPSFSKVNLRDFANRLKVTGAQAALCRIQMTDPAS